MIGEKMVMAYFNMLALTAFIIWSVCQAFMRSMIESPGIVVALANL
jgi:hypothetical protein